MQYKIDAATWKISFWETQGGRKSRSDRFLGENHGERKSRLGALDESGAKRPIVAIAFLEYRPGYEMIIRSRFTQIRVQRNFCIYLTVDRNHWRAAVPYLWVPCWWKCFFCFCQPLPKSRLLGPKNMKFLHQFCVHEMGWEKSFLGLSNGSDAVF